jgi:hypothetical protein
MWLVGLTGKVRFGGGVGEVALEIFGRGSARKMISNM